ncbi:MAG: hypothetical protein ACXVQX_11635 [Actinomycetota bacterium]
MKKFFAAGLVAIAIAALAIPASASTQTIDATLGSTLAMTATPSSTVSWTLASTGANTTSGGAFTINSNQPYTATVTADKSAMTEWTGSGYAASPKTLSTALSVVSARSAGTAAVPGVGATAVIDTSTLLATGTGLGTDTYDVTLSQPTVITDSALPAGETYHIVLTYTASSTL